MCSTPSHLNNRSLRHVFEGELRCNDERRAYDEYQVSIFMVLRAYDIYIKVSTCIFMALRAIMKIPNNLIK